MTERTGVYLSGQADFGNRGCEAIVRSTAALVRSQSAGAAVMVPSSNVRSDSELWPEATEVGVRWTSVYRPRLTRAFVHLQRLPLAPLKRMRWPFGTSAQLEKDLSDASLVLAVGGDNYSLDYRLPSLYVGLDGLAMAAGVPVVLWGASVGPFDKEPYFVPFIKAHLARMAHVAVRESESFRYLTETLGLKNVSLVADPAFTLVPSEVSWEPQWADASLPVLGFNISPLVARYRGDADKLLGECADFLRSLIQTGEWNVLLVPHVMPHSDTDWNDDERYLRRLLQLIGGSGAVQLVPRDQNAAELKRIIGRVAFFIGARTHATIAALSSGVPTLSLSYSVKARGINNDIFGSLDMVLPSRDVSSRSLGQRFRWLVENQADMRKALGATVPILQMRARSGMAQAIQLARR